MASIHSARIFLLQIFFFVLKICLVDGKNNVILILTDDQDSASSIPMTKTMMLIAEQGTTFKNSFVNTPLCCPSRSTLLTGLYQHNTHVWNNSLEGNCNSNEWQRKHEPHTFAKAFLSAGYRTFYAGKYLNQYGSHKAGGLGHVPQGWQWWAGLKGNSRYYNYTLSVNGSAKHFDTSYLTDHIHDLATEFLRIQTKNGPPFLMMLAPPAPHAPYTPAPKYADCFPNESVPRTPNFNPSFQEEKHWIIRMPPNPLPSDIISRVDEYWRQRWRTLLSVDDMVASIIQSLKRLRLLKNTFILVTSDNGYHLGQYGLPWDKRQPYDSDIRVPLFVRGPRVRRQVLHNAVMTADIAPTLLDMAGLKIPPHMDGTSFYSSLLSSKKRFKKRSFIVTYFGEGGKYVSSLCSWYHDDNLYSCDPESACKCQDAKNNTYACIRTIGPIDNSAFCKFNDKEEFLEAYNLQTDPFQMKNIVHRMPSKEIYKYIVKLKNLQTCSGISCITH